MMGVLAALCCILLSFVLKDTYAIDGTGGDKLLQRRSLKQRADDAGDYWAEGDLSQDEGKPNEALPFYRAALRMFPESLDYQLKVAEVELRLGVNENRMDLIQKAYKRIQIVVSKDPANEVAKNYLLRMNEDYNFCVEESCMYWSGLTNVHDFPELSPSQELSACGANCFDFASFNHRSAQPFVMRNVLQFLGCDLSVFELESLYEEHRTVPVDFYPQNMIVKPTKVYNVPLSKALQYLVYPEGAYMSVDASELGTYIQWNINETVWDKLLARTRLNRLPGILTHSMDSLFAKHTKDVRTGDVFTTGTTTVDNPATPSASKIDVLKHTFGLKTHWYMLLLGEADAGMFPHQDTLSVGSWQAQVAGSKRWRVCSPTPPSDLTPGLQGPQFAMGTEKGQLCYETILHTGDLIYYPPYYWHETKNLESPSASLSGTVVVDAAVHDNVGAHVPSGFGTNYKDALLNSLRLECRDKTKGFGFDAELCDALS